VLAGYVTVAANIIPDLPSLSIKERKNMRLLIPTYFESNSIWAKAYAVMTAGDIAILNPNNGVGASKDTVYTNIVHNIVSRSIIPVGYVYTSHGTRAAATVKAQIDNWFSWYGITGIFLDEVGEAASTLPYFTDMYNYVKTRNGLVILNPGTVTLEQFVTISDIICDYEDSYTNYVSATFPAWRKSYPTSKFANLAYSCSAAQCANAVTLANARGTGYVYFTDDVLNNPWDSLASYLTSEKALLGGSPTPTPTPTPTPDYQALYDAEVVLCAQKDAQIAALNTAMATFKTNLKTYIDTH
jgi:hypothetical protein